MEDVALNWNDLHNGRQRRVWSRGLQGLENLCKRALRVGKLAGSRAKVQKENPKVGSARLNPKHDQDKMTWGMDV